jgi:hypothetical protein
MSNLYDRLMGGAEKTQGKKAFLEMRQKWDSSKVKNMIVMRLAAETKKKLGWNSQNNLRTSYDHYFGRVALSQK